MIAKAATIIEELKIQTEQLSKKDIASWRRDHQMAVNRENPKRGGLINTYDFTTSLDPYVMGILQRTKLEVMQRKFRLVEIATGKEDVAMTNLLEASWFKQFMALALDARYWGCSLIELGEVITTPRAGYSYVRVVPRYNVIPEFGLIIKDKSDDPAQGYDYRKPPLSDWCIQVGDPFDLGLFLQATPSAISKKHAKIFWDNFAERFGIPIIYATTDSRNEGDRYRMQNMLKNMGSAASGLFAAGTELKIIETKSGDAFQVFDKRIDRANNELAICLAGQNMVFENGASRSQAQVHQDGFEMIINQMADSLKDVINDQLLPRMTMHGIACFDKHRFEWNDAYEFSPKEMMEVEQMLLNNYEIDQRYFIDKYGVMITGKKEITALQSEKLRSFFD